MKPGAAATSSNAGGALLRKEDAMNAARMPSRIARLAAVAVFAVAVALPIAQALPLPLRARSPQLLASAASAGVAFAAVGINGDLVVVGPTALLSVATYLAPDAGGFGNSLFFTGLAVDGTGQVFVVGTDFSNSYLARADFESGAATTVGTITGEVIVDLAFDGTGHLYALTDNANGTDPHALLALNPTNGAATVAKLLDGHGGKRDFGQNGAIAWNAGDQHLYYADTDSTDLIFVDQLAPSTFAQTSVLSGPFRLPPTAMGFASGRLWLFTNGGAFSADAGNIGGGLTKEGFPSFPTPDGTYFLEVEGVATPTLACAPSPTAACLGNRFKVEVTYDATPNNGMGPGNVVLESSESVKFTFFDPANIEMILKVLDGCGLNSKWWVFAGGLTNVGVTIKVTDTATGASKTYTSPKGKLFQTFADTSAFGCP
jgi:hypothetical protein